VILLLRDVIAGVLLLVGAFFSLAAVIGLIRLPDLFSRMHAASKAGTMGSCVMLLALAVAAADPAIATRALAGVLFFMLTAPLSAHLLAKAAYSAGYRLWSGSVRDDMQQAYHSTEQRPARQK
jgi:multicomponent Na+:H+ antiporter subunit G